MSLKAYRPNCQTARSAAFAFLESSTLFSEHNNLTKATKIVNYCLV